MRRWLVVISLSIPLACSGGDDVGGGGGGGGGGGNQASCQVSGDNITRDDAVLDADALAAHDDCMNGAYAGSDPYRAEACLMLDLINADRAMFADEADGAPSLDWNEDLWEVAVLHAQDMCDRDYFAHTNPDGQDSGDRAAEFGITDYWVGENILNWPDVESGHAGFMNEPTCTGHRRQILDPKALSVGVGVTQCNGQGNYSVTQNYEVHLDLPGSPYCADGAETACRVPSDEYTSADCTSICSDATDVVLSDWGCDC